MRRTPWRIRDLAELAARQHGIVTLAQLRGLGLSRSSIAYRHRIGRLHVVHRGVYAVGHPELSEEGRFLAAVLAVGEDAVVSHIAAAVLCEFWPRSRDSEPVDVSVTRRIRGSARIRLHVVRALPAADVTRYRGIPVTTPARTLVDLAGVAVNDRALRRAVHEAEVQRRVSHPQLVAQIERTTGRRAAARLAGLITGGPAPTRSELEDLTLELFERHRLPRPLTNVPITDVPHPTEVDFLFPDDRLIVEADGRRYHDTVLAREADSRKQAMLEAAGYRVMRLSWEQVTREQAETVRRLRSALGRAF